MMKTCDEMMILLATRRELSHAQEQQVQAHLARCTACSSQWELEERTSRALRSLLPPAQHAVERAVSRTDRRIERELARGAWWRWARPLGGVMVAGVLVIALIFGWAGGEEHQRVAGDKQGAPVGAARPSPASVTHTPVMPGGNVSDAPTPDDQVHPQATATMLPTNQPAPEDTATSNDTSTEEAVASDEQTVRHVVEQLGRQLRFVSVLAPREVLSSTMQKHYAAFVSADLLERWVQDPLQAPGRQTSSPWPARIDVSSLRRVNEAEYLVSGAIILVTGPDETDSQVISRIPIQLSVEQRQERWLITGYQQEDGATMAAETILDYYAAINGRKYDQAYRFWKENGAASGQSLEQFQQGYQNTAHISLILDDIQRPADSQPVRVAVRLLAVINDPSVAHESGQQVQLFDGSYTLEPAGAGEDSVTGWVIANAKITAAEAASLPPGEFATPEQTLVTYYEAINQQNYALAYSAWERLGQASEQSLAQFRQGFAETASVAIELGQPQLEGAAGSVYARVPIVVVATQADGSQQAFCGVYELRHLNHVPWDQLGWRIDSAEIEQTAPVELNSDQSRRLLTGGCAAE